MMTDLNPRGVPGAACSLPAGLSGRARKSPGLTRPGDVLQFAGCCTTTTAAGAPVGKLRRTALTASRPPARLNGQAVQHRGRVPRERRAIGPRRQVAVLHGPLEPLP